MGTKNLLMNKGISSVTIPDSIRVLAVKLPDGVAVPFRIKDKHLEIRDYTFSGTVSVEWKKTRPLEAAAYYPMS